VRIHFGGEAIGGKRRARRDVQATEARGSCRAPRRGAAGTLDQGGTSEGHPLRQRGESEGGHGAGSLARQEVCAERELLSDLVTRRTGESSASTRAKQ
jgi:hypothetical protein